MSGLCVFNLQPYIDNYNCTYYVETGSDKDSIDYALHFPFFRIYSLDKRERFIEEARAFYQFNPRVHLFIHTHEQAFYELIRMVPVEFNAVIWIADGQVNQSIEYISKARPAKTDVVIIDSKYLNTLGDFVSISKFFGLTHQIHTASLGLDGHGLVLIPNKVHKPVNYVMQDGI